MAKKRKRNPGPGSKRKSIKRFKRHAGTVKADLGIRLLRGLKKHGTGPRGSPRKNPTQLLFRTKKAARAYAKQHGAGMAISVRKIKRGK